MIQVNDVGYTYQTKYQKVEALKNVTCTFEYGKYYAIVGESGSGKSTFLSLLAGLDTPTIGEIVIDGVEIKNLNRDEYRSQKAAMVYQSFYLFPLLTALENVRFPLELNGLSKKKATEKARLLLNQVGINEELEKHYPRMLSGGEQQRVAIARAMATGGKIILADEPTGNLDSKNEKIIVRLLAELVKKENYMVIVVTHNPFVAEAADRIYRMQDGMLGEEKANVYL
ncbi:ABC-type lipoprotein export system ATPase subunit [Lachnospiraceae bacterium PM6-15]|uniref:ABC transporter ATP-binding protein n=1 Tax=Ohessyouella blattaphilus TaxID=2949333 RepID=UPI00256BAF8F|nr:ABC transporter ATP-binding protein [Lachnospiraceae bacterium OttesenSCG-928-J05]